MMMMMMIMIEDSKSHWSRMRFPSWSNQMAFTKCWSRTSSIQDRSGCGYFVRPFRSVIDSGLPKALHRNLSSKLMYVLFDGDDSSEDQKLAFLLPSYFNHRSRCESHKVLISRKLETFENGTPVHSIANSKKAQGSERRIGEMDLPKDRLRSSVTWSTPSNSWCSGWGWAVPRNL